MTKQPLAQQIAVVPNLQPTCKYRVIALDPSVRGSDQRILTAEIEIPNEELAPGPRGYRVQGVDYDASNRILYQPAPYRASDLLKVPSRPEKDRAFKRRHTYEIVLRLLARSSRALGRPARWTFPVPQLP